MSKWQDYYSASGVKVAPGDQIPVRQDFRTFTKQQTWLYLEGLKRFQNADAEDPLSWFQIAGIHGLPYQTWPTYEKEINQTGNGGGFCTHSSILFLTWHRPYLALFESTLHGHVQLIAQGIDEKHAEKRAYMALAKGFRMPYWDWARKDVQPAPEEALDPKYRGPQGPWSKHTLAEEKGAEKANYNPLFQAPLPTEPVKGIRKEWLDHILRINGQTWQNTVRYPNQEGSPNTFKDQMAIFYKTPSGVEDSRLLNRLSSAPPPGVVERNLTERTVYILQAYSTFVAMSRNALREDPKTKTIIPDKENWGSLEDIHNAVHNIAGGGGYMSQVEKSAFDPIFWLHHTNIDRLFAIWQALHETDDNENTYVVPRYSGGTFTSKRDKDWEDISTKLYPFKYEAKAGSWYTSQDTKRTEPFGYSYEETFGLSWPTTKGDREKVKKRIGDLYLPVAEEIRKSIVHDPRAGAELLQQAAIAGQIHRQGLSTVENLQTVLPQLPSPESLLKTSNEPGKPVLRNPAPDNKYLEWIVNIKAAKHALNGRYAVHVFLGPADEESDTSLWSVVPTHVGTFNPLGQPQDTACEKCQAGQAANLEVTGQIPLTVALVERYLAGVVGDLTPESVVPYLQEHLHWRVTKNDGTLVEDQSDVSNLTVFVVTNEVELPEDPDKLPVYAPDVTVYPAVTTNANGGSRGHGTGLTERYAH